MKIYAICLVKNEDDIIGQSLTYATRYCDKIFVIDNGSTDQTWKIVQSLSTRYPQIVPFAQKPERFDDGLRWVAYDAHHHELSDADWWMILDADEFLAEDPRPVIQEAMQKNADIVRAWIIQFYYTEKDHEAWLDNRESRDLAVFERRRYYRINWQEVRLFRNRSSGTWATSVICRKGRMSCRNGRVFRRRILIRHYQYRDPEQIEKRLKSRYRHPSFASRAMSLDWRSVLKSSRDLYYYRDGEPWRFRVTDVLFWYYRAMRHVGVSILDRGWRLLNSFPGAGRGMH